MAIALDARWLQHPLHGIARYTLNLLQFLPLNPAGEPLLVIYNRADFVIAEPGQSLFRAGRDVKRLHRKRTSR